MAVGSCVTVGVGVSACGGEDHSTASSTTALVESTSAAPETVTAVTVMQYWPSSSAAASSTTVPELTTTIAGTSGEEAARAGVLAQIGVAELAMYEALRQPDVDEEEVLGPVEAATVAGSQAREQLVAAVRANRAVGNVGVPSGDVAITVTAEGDVLVLGESGAEVMVCVVNSETVVSVNQAGERSVVSGGVVANRARETFTLGEDGPWRLSDFEILEQFPGGSTCPAA